ncbi:MAG TPA: ABC transporter ATP-binding protein [Polyangiaceae bacterium]|nr:ABC transporter ATP-binding protein [Polyangiaceae bacterium]
MNLPTIDLPSARRLSPGRVATPLLRVSGLAIDFGGVKTPMGAVDDATFDVARGETVCLVGESGCGKTVTALSLLRLEVFRHGRIVAGDIVFDGHGLVDMDRRKLDQLRGQRIAMIFQEPMTAFDPVFSIGEQIVETILRHEQVSRAEAWQRAVKLLERVHIPDADLRMKQIPEELSGGMRQRAMIAMALACKPDLLIADEPTTALDVTIQAQILALLKELQREEGMAILLITHDLGVAAEMADRVVVMYAGRIAEQASVTELFARPLHPYTRGLLRSSVLPTGQGRGTRLAAIPGSMPRLDEMPDGCRFHPRCSLASERCREQAPTLQRVGGLERDVSCWHAFDSEPSERVRLPIAPVVRDEPGGGSNSRVSNGPLVEALHVTKTFDTRRGLFAGRRRVHAVDDFSLAIQPGETLGLVGESGCGKSTLGRLLLQLATPTSGEIRFEGRSLLGRGRADRRRVRREMQMIFQDPYGSIDPRWTVADVIAEPLLSFDRPDRAALRDQVDELLALVGLQPSYRTRYAHEFSGGQRQRIGIARAIALRPKFILADEAVSALDLSVQAQIINLFVEQRERLGLTCLFIGHGLHLVRHVSDRVGVMYLGRLVEVAPAEALFEHPAHHYSYALLASSPIPDPTRRREFVAPLGELPSPTAPPSGCHFHPRCPAASERCRKEIPALRELEPGRSVACHFPR